MRYSVAVFSLKYIGLDGICQIDALFCRCILPEEDRVGWQLLN